MTDLDTQITTLHRALHPEMDGYGRLVWFCQMLRERAALDRTTKSLQNWRRDGVPENVRRVVDELVRELADDATEKHQAVIDELRGLV